MPDGEGWVCKKRKACLLTNAIDAAQMAEKTLAWPEQKVMGVNEVALAELRETSPRSERRASASSDADES